MVPFQAHNIPFLGSQRQERNRLQRRQVEVRIPHFSPFLCIYLPCQLKNWKPIIRTHEMRMEGDGEGEKKREREEEEGEEEENKENQKQ